MMIFSGKGVKERGRKMNGDRKRGESGAWDVMGMGRRREKGKKGFKGIRGGMGMGYVGIRGIRIEAGGEGRGGGGG
ncbi:hypothetical protein, partial [Bacillus pumilus]|uniref:hypothetical protein n=1 Tax=Bacillus pumilus TaxID=1408 RepID=UPI001C92E973